MNKCYKISMHFEYMVFVWNVCVVFARWLRFRYWPYCLFIDLFWFYLFTSIKYEISVVHQISLPYKIGVMLGGHVRAVFTFVTIIFIGCVIVTLDSFREIPLWRLESVSLSQSVVVIEESADAKPTSPTTEQSALNDKLQLSDPINRTSSYGALSNQNLNIPTNAVRKLMPSI